MDVGGKQRAVVHRLYRGEFLSVALDSFAEAMQDRMAALGPERSPRRKRPPGSGESSLYLLRAARRYVRDV